MTFALRNNFWLNSRGITFEDSTSVTWAFNGNSNQITATVVSAIPSGANPTASVGLTAVNGTAATFMRSDAAPALNQAIVPTWSGLHTFGAGLTVSAGSFTLSGHTLALSANASVGGTNTGDQALPVGANPSASVGLAAVNGAAASFMRSDGAPALSVAITPTWTGQHTWKIAGANTVIALDTFATFASNIQFLQAGSFVAAAGVSGGAGQIIVGDSSGDFDIRTQGGTIRMSANSGASTQFSLGVNGNSGPAQSTGWGTPTGGTVVASFAAGATPSLLQMSEAVAQIIVVLKQVGIFAA